MVLNLKHHQEYLLSIFWVSAKPCKTKKKIGNEIDGLYKFKGIISRLNLSILCKITHLESILCVVRV